MEYQNWVGSGASSAPLMPSSEVGRGSSIPTIYI